MILVYIELLAVVDLERCMVVERLTQEKCKTNCVILNDSKTRML